MNKMMTMPESAQPVSIQLDSLSKYYMRGQERAETLKEQIFKRLSQRHFINEIRALDEVNLSIRRGEAVALIGLNGSGKSTMLKLIAGVCAPSHGTVQTHGRVLGLIELGAGFHPDLTGVENVRLQGAVYGLSRQMIESKLDSIIDFAGLKDFKDVPVKHYSSGMFVRLGFAIAMHVEPDILLVDEVLSVGDLAFQERCFETIAAMRAGGMTLVLVTHDAAQAERVCERAVWLESGRMRESGPIAQVLATYYADLIQSRYGQSQGSFDQSVMMIGQPGRFGDGAARIETLRILNQYGQPCANFKCGEPIVIEIDYTASPEVKALECMLPLESSDMSLVTVWRSQHAGPIIPPPSGRGCIRLKIDSPALAPMQYVLTASLAPWGYPYNHNDVLYKLFNFSIRPEPGWDVIAPVILNSSISLV